jgi:hypothetical protein
MTAPARVRALVTAFLTLTTLAWVFAIPPGAGYDEMSHYVKALGVGRGQAWGTPDRVHREDRLVIELRKAFGQANTVQPPKFAWLVRTRREFVVPSSLAVGESCDERSKSGCVHGVHPTGRPYARSYVGTYAPFFYVLPGLPTRAASSPSTAIRLGRLATAALCVALLVVTALLLLRDPRSDLALLGLVGAISPAVLYVAATINPSGPEIAAAACFGAALMAACDGGRVLPWAAAGVSGTVLAACRPLGPAFVVLALAAVGVMVGQRAVRAALGRGAAIAAAPIALAAVANVAWDGAREPHPHVTTGDIGPGLSDAWDALPSLGEQLVGSFGSFDLKLPLIGYYAWGAVVIAVLVLSIRVASTRERTVLLGLVAAVIGLVFLLSVTQRPTGFVVQTRYVLPVVALLMVLAGDVLRSHREAVSPRLARGALVGVCAAAAAVHAAAWISAAGGWDRYVDDVVEPPGGWLPWSIAMGAGVAALAAAGLAARTAGSRPRRSPTPSRR